MVKQIETVWLDEKFIITVDDTDYPLLSRHFWRIDNGYGKRKPYAYTQTWSVKEGDRRIMMHHLVAGGYSMIDHINGNTLDNRYENLRPATKSQNGANRSKSSTVGGKPTSSKYKGVHWAANQGKWRAVCCKDRKVHHCGSFNNEDDAARAYNKKAVELHGEYAKLNIIATDTLDKE